MKLKNGHHTTHQNENYGQISLQSPLWGQSLPAIVESGWSLLAVKNKRKSLDLAKNIWLLLVVLLVPVKFLSGQVAHRTRAYLSFCSIKQLRVHVSLLPHAWDASPWQGYP